VTRLVALWGGAAVLVVAIGYYASTRPELSLLAAAGVCLFGLTLMDSAFIPLLMVVPALVTYRIGLGGTDLTVSDAALFVAFFPAVVLGQRPFTPAMRSLVWLGVIYEASTLFTVIANPYQANVIEWVHAALLTIGALVVGWSIGRGGHARVALSLLLIACTGVAIGAILQGLMQYAQGDFSSIYPKWPFSMHKNSAGCLFGFAAALAYARPTWLGWSRWFALGCFWICVGGIAFTQSRQAMAGLALALIVLVMRTRRAGQERRSRVILFGVAASLGVVAVMVRNQIASGNEFNSFFARLDWFEQSVRVWHEDPVLGVGLRWWYTDRFESRFQPPNGVLEMLTTAGIVGLAGFVILLGGAVLVLWRMDPTYGVPAAIVLLSRILQGQLDLFWVAAQTSVPFLIVGICVGAHGRHLADPVPPEPAETNRRVETSAV
jgi:polysaccharide biosynthesis protein PslJ